MKQSKRKREASGLGVPAPTPAVAVAVQAQQTQAANTASATKRVATHSLYKLAPSCTVRDCAPLKIALSDLVNVESDAILDVSAIERIDTAVMQLLYAFVRDRKTHNRKVMWQGSSECFREAVQLLGMATHLDVLHAGDLGHGATP